MDPCGITCFNSSGRCDVTDLMLELLRTEKEQSETLLYFHFSTSFKSIAWKTTKRDYSPGELNINFD